MRLVADVGVAGDRHRVEAAAGEAVLVADGVPARLLGEARDRDDRIRLDGRRIDRLSPAARIRAGLAAVAGAPVAEDVSVRDHLAAITTPAEADRLVAGAPRLAGRGGDMAGVLSGGERLVLAWLRAVALDPAAVVLDAAGAGADDEVLAWMGGRVEQWWLDGVSVVIRASRPEERSWAGA